MTGRPINLTVLGAGAWGTALAAAQVRHGHHVTLWGRDDAVLSAIKSSRQNPRYLPDIQLPQSIVVTGDIAAALGNTQLVLLATPAQTIAAMAQTMAPFLDEQTPLILCAKGINQISGLLPAETLRQSLPHNPVAALSGPSFAGDVARNLPTAVTLATENPDLASYLAERLSGPTFRVYASDDLKGVELGGALKNVIALAIGVCRGLELGASAEAALIARGFAELNRLAIALGAKPQTLMGLSGLGDLVLTCSSPQSRNFVYGIALGKGHETKDMPLAEGALTAGIAARLANAASVDCPVIETVVKLLEGRVSAIQASHQLLTRPLKSERE